MGEFEAGGEVVAQTAERAAACFGGDATVAETGVGHLGLFGELGDDGGGSLGGAAEHVDLVRVLVFWLGGWGGLGEVGGGRGGEGGHDGMW